MTSLSLSFDAEDFRRQWLAQHGIDCLAMRVRVLTATPCPAIAQDIIGRARSGNPLISPSKSRLP